MREKEKETIEDCKELVQELKQHKDKDFIGRLYYKNKPVEDILSVLLNLIEKQQKEIDELRKENIKWKESAEYNYEQYQDIGKSCFDLQEIEKSHKEENGKLRVEFEKVYEDNLTLANELEKYKRLAEMNLKDAEEFQNNMCEHRCILYNEIEELKTELFEEKEKNKNTGKLVKNKIDGTFGIVLREWETGQVQVLEKIQPKVINTHDSWETLELLEEK